MNFPPQKLYTFAVKEKSEELYLIPSYVAGISVHKTPEEARSDAEAHKLDSLEYIIMDIGPLVEEGVISRHKLFGSGVR